MKSIFFEKGKSGLTISMLDEDKRFDTIVIKNGVEYEFFEEIDRIVIGVVWVTELKGNKDYRIWYWAESLLEGIPLVAQKYKEICR